ncbi:hypothetical protein NJI34_34635 [Pseudomonas sp. S 311-6]|nr:hypothetical protein [Pseudomonas sp. S 311-6]
MLSPDYRPAGVRPARFYPISEPEGMTAKEHAAVIRDSLARDRDVQFIHANKRHREKAADFTWDELINDDSARELLIETIRIEAAGGSDVAISVAFKRFVQRTIDCAAEAAENIDSQGRHFTYLPGGRL